MQPCSLRRRAAFFLIAGATLLPLPAAAHAIIVSSDPAVDAVVRPPLPVMLRFNSRIDRERSRLTLLRPDGSSQPVALVADGRPDTLAARLDDLAPGRYRLRWQVLAIDGHITRGDIPFAVGE